ncbi:MAG: DUF2075 domain-containing protein [Zetaproteobacteria bacterium]|nr:MAG: DUF2075 domain-containing protein [Zetaproteobacteria bacterium]
MYCTFFRLQAPPFSIAPDPRYLYPSRLHQEALAHLIYGIGNAGGGIVVLTGEVGTGKTTLCRALIGQLPERTDAALIVNPRLTAHELLAAICDELSIRYDRRRKSIKLLVDAINRHLLAAHADGRHTVVIIDEAQQLDAEVLEQLRLLTNLETDEKKLLQIILFGQPELNALLARPHLRQLAQRITARYHLRPLSRAETIAYVRHRLGVVGGDGALFTAPALWLLHRLSGGVPRMINTIADRALLGAYARGRGRVGWRTVRRAAVEVLGGGAPGRPMAPAPAAAGGRLPWLVALLLLVVLLWLLAANPQLIDGWRRWLIALLSGAEGG